MSQPDWATMVACPMLIPRDNPPKVNKKGGWLKTRLVQCGRPAGHHGACKRYNLHTGAVVAVWPR